MEESKLGSLILGSAPSADRDLEIIAGRLLIWLLK